MIQNTEQITRIVMKPFAECLCEIGKDWYHISFEIEFCPNAYYPDYMDVSAFVSKEISGKQLNIEKAVDTIGNMLLNVYAPKSLKVKGIVNDVITHFPVEVEKRYYE